MTEMGIVSFLVAWIILQPFFISGASDQTKKECVVCLELLEQKNRDRALLPCKHELHLDCWQEFVKKTQLKSVCPTCRDSGQPFSEYENQLGQLKNAESCGPINSLCIGLGVGFGGIAGMICCAFLVYCVIGSIEGGC